MPNTPTTIHQKCLSIQHDLKAFLQGVYQTNVERRGQIKGHLFSCEDCTLALAEIMVEESDCVAETREPTKTALPPSEILKMLGVVIKQGVFHWEKLKRYAEQDWTWAKIELSRRAANIQETLKAVSFIIEETDDLAYAHLGATEATIEGKSMIAEHRDAAGQLTGQDISMEILTSPIVTTDGQFILRLRSDDNTLEGFTARCFLKTVEQMQIAFEGTVTKELSGQGVELIIQAEGLPKVDKNVTLPLDYLALEFVQEPPIFLEKKAIKDTSNVEQEIPENSCLSECQEAINKTRLTALLKDLQQAFEMAPEHRLSSKTIEERIHAFIGSPFLHIREKRIQVFNELIKTRIFSIVQNASASPTNGEQEVFYRLRWEITPHYIVNRFWGIPLEDGLNIQFEGGLVPRANSGVSALIIGDCGVGKSMMAIHMTALFASQGFSGVYVTTEGDLGLFIEKLSVLGYILKTPVPENGPWIFSRHGREFALETCNFLIGQVEIQPPLRQKNGEYGILTFMKVTPGFEGVTHQEILENLQLISKGITGESCIVFDCMDEIFQNIKEATHHLFSKLFHLNPMQIGLFVSSLEIKSSILQWARKKADIILKLNKVIRGKGVIDRALTIMKSETQRCNMGTHYFSIDRPDGFVIFPSPVTLSHIWDRRMQFKEKQPLESWRLDENFLFDPIFHNDIRRGSSILLRGPGATHRFPIALSFLASVIKDEPEAQVILLSLRENPINIIQTIQNYPQLFPLLTEDGNDFNARVEVGYLPPNRFGPERILHWARTVLAKRLNKNRPVRRVLFSNFSQFRNSSLFEEDDVFIRTLVQLFNKQDVTSLYIDTVDEQSRSLPEGFEAVLRTFNDEDGQRPQIKIEYTATCNASHSPYQIIRERTDKMGQPDKMGNFRRLRLVPTTEKTHSFAPPPDSKKAGKTD